MVPEKLENLGVRVSRITGAGTGLPSTPRNQEPAISPNYHNLEPKNNCSDQLLAMTVQAQTSTKHMGNQATGFFPICLNQSFRKSR